MLQWGVLPSGGSGRAPGGPPEEPVCPSVQECSAELRGGGRHPATQPADPTGQEAREGLGHPSQSSQQARWAGLSPSSHHADPQAGDPAPREGPRAWAQPLTFQRFPHSLQTTNVVMGSSELRVCTWGGDMGGPSPGVCRLA